MFLLLIFYVMLTFNGGNIFRLLRGVLYLRRQMHAYYYSYSFVLPCKKESVFFYKWSLLSVLMAYCGDLLSHSFRTSFFFHLPPTDSAVTVESCRWHVSACLQMHGSLEGMSHYKVFMQISFQGYWLSLPSFLVQT